MSVLERFEALTSQWADHCERVVLSSNVRDYLAHPAFRGLVALGHEAVPYIMARYEDDDFLPWGFVLDEITGLGMIVNPNQFNPAEIQDRWLTWWQTEGERSYPKEQAGHQTN